MLFVNICLLLLTTISTALSGSEINIISSGSFKGLASPSGEVLIPAVHDEIGWSDGTVFLENEVIGYRDEGKWGLINTKNKKITQPVYNSLVPIGEEIFVASRKANLSNHLYHGLIDKKGEVLVSFNYFSISRLTATRIKVGDYKEGRVLHGIRSTEDVEIIPCSYQSIDLLDNLIVCYGEDELVRIFDLDGKPIYNRWLDRVTRHPEGFEIVEEGRSGLVSADHRLISYPSLKGLSEEGRHRFNRWEVRSLVKDSVFYESCDSITILNENLWIAHVNDAEHMLGAHERLFSNQKYHLKYVQRGFIVAQNKQSGNWGLYKTTGEPVGEGYDFIRADSNYFYCRSGNSWDIYNAFSRKLNDHKFEEVSSSINRNIPVKKNGFWGFVDFMGDPLVSYKFDDVAPGIENQYLARYVGKWGIANLPESWMALPEFDTIEVDTKFYLARKGRATYVFDEQGDLLLKTGFDVFVDKDVIYLREDDSLGLITALGSIIDPQYQSVKKVGEFYVCKRDSTLEMINPYGRKVLTAVDGVEEVFSYSEGYFHILKDGKHGFVDENGKLRVANRYDGALPYNEDMAAVKLRGKWGYINKWEQLVVQPHYDTCSVFENGLANVAVAGKHGIINNKGEIIINPDFEWISRTPYGNYVMTNQGMKQGLADETGRILLSPNFDEVIDTAHEFVVARQGESYGVVKYNGHSYVPFNYRQVEVQGDYLLLLSK